MKYWEILNKCAEIAKEREQSYWDVLDMLDTWEDIHRNLFSTKLTREQLVETMISIKLTREQNKHKEDNLLDLINYIAIYSLLKDYKIEEQSEDLFDVWTPILT